jgi:putative SOS response-associated peptidase YedK
MGLTTPEEATVCARYTLKTHPRRLAELFGLPAEPLLDPRWNIAPSQTVPVVRDEASERVFGWMKWGLIPSWAKDPSIGYRLLNARCETVADKPSFRGAYRKRRCLLPADGFYEWQAVGRQKQPYHFRLRDGEPFALAGLWETWAKPEGGVLSTCTLLTTQANDLVRPVHDRMPVILALEDYRAWLELHPVEDRLFSPFPADRMESLAVSTWVNRATNEGPQCLGPAA